MNLIERMNKEIRRRIKIIDSLPSEGNAISLHHEDHSLRGFYMCIDKIREMFQERYPL